MAADYSELQRLVSPQVALLSKFGSDGRKGSDIVTFRSPELEEGKSRYATASSRCSRSRSSAAKTDSVVTSALFRKGRGRNDYERLAETGSFRRKSAVRERYQAVVERENDSAERASRKRKKIFKISDEPYFYSRTGSRGSRQLRESGEEAMMPCMRRKMQQVRNQRSMKRMCAAMQSQQSLSGVQSSFDT